MKLLFSLNLLLRVKKRWCTALLPAFLGLLAIQVQAAEPVRLVGEIPGTSAIVIAAEGDLEPRSTGSYTLRVYDVINERFPYDNFVTGVVRSRDGALEDIRFSDLDGNIGLEIIVVMRSVGTGSFLAADGFLFHDNALEFLETVSGLARDADPVSALAAKLHQSDMPPSATIRQATWKWSAVADSGESSELVVSHPENYTLAFDLAGKVNIRADCNMVLGSYIIETQDLAISTFGPSTMAFCGEGSLDREFLGLLDLVERFNINNGRLVLHLQDDGRRMIFDREQ
jgi:heat shock protein HslJ